MKKQKFYLVAATVAVFLFMAVRESQACSRVLWAKNGEATVVGRNMDWMLDMFTNLWVFPRGMVRNGLAGDNSLNWTSKYGSVVAGSYDIAASDGLNEKGLNAALLWLAESDFGKRDPKQPGLSASLWAQFFLDNFATVKEAVATMKKNPFQVIPLVVPGAGCISTIHLALADVSGDSAIIEFINGQPRIYHGKQYKVMTNSPPFDQQLKNLAQYKGFGGNKSLPGSSEAADRFVRAAYYLGALPKPKNYRQAVGGMYSVMRNVAQPFVQEKGNLGEPYVTLWTSVSDLTDKTYYYSAWLSPNVIWASLEKFNLKPGSMVMKLDITKNQDRIGDVSAQFKPSPDMAFMAVPKNPPKNAKICGN